ncbi:MAG: FAD:protein FMN transferase, partial [Pollutimonas bauzanensis]
PTPDAISRALRSVDYRAIQLDASRIQLMRPDMKLTLNGIAQGYITDRVAQLLHNAGLDRALVDMGEIRGLDSRAAGAPWRVGLADPEHPERTFETVELRNQALATSGGYGTTLDAAGRFAHIFDPKTGLDQPRYRSVSVMAQQATAADALSTAFSTMTLAQAAPVIKKLGVQAWFILPDGSRKVLGGA